MLITFQFSFSEPFMWSFLNSFFLLEQEESLKPTSIADGPFWTAGANFGPKFTHFVSFYNLLEITYLYQRRVEKLSAVPFCCPGSSKLVNTHL